MDRSPGSRRGALHEPTLQRGLASLQNRPSIEMFHALWLPHGGQMTEDELQELVKTVAEAHAGLSEVAFKLRRELTPKGPALKAAIKAERETFRLKRAAQHPGFRRHRIGQDHAAQCAH